MGQDLTKTGVCLFCGDLAPVEQSYCCPACRWLDSRAKTQSPSPAAQAIPPELEYLRQKDFLTLYDFSSTPSERQFRLFVEGLQCASCLHLLEKLPEYEAQILEARVNFAQSELWIKTTPQVDLARVIFLLKDMGYPSRFLQRHEDSHALQTQEDRDLLKRLAVAGASAANIMLFTVPIYAGLEGLNRDLFHYFGFFLFLPVLFYAAKPFYRGAWTSLRTGVINVDLPLTLAFLAGFAFSSFNLFRGSDQIYFDSTAGFLFLILVSRWTLRKAQRQALHLPSSWSPLFPESLDLVEEGRRLALPIRNFQAGQQVRLSEGQILPFDGRLLSAQASFDTSWVDGEPFPRVFQEGQLVSAGLKLRAPSCHILIEKDFEHSEIQKTLLQGAREALSQSQKLNAFDLVSRRLLVGVFLLALFFFVGAPFLFDLPWEEAFRRSLALIVIACPCALAFASPLAHSLALKKAREKGLLIKSTDVFHHVLEAKNWIFDKTGTLTEGRLQLSRSEPALLSPRLKDLILGLEAKSLHPVAFAFREAWGARSAQALPVHDIHETEGGKLFGVCENRLYCLRSSPLDEGGQLRVLLERDGQPLAEFFFEDRLRRESAEVLAHLKSLGHRVFLLSGDLQIRVEELARQLGLKGEETVKGKQTSTQKLDFVSQHQPAVMIGDGINDAPALAAARVGVAVNGALDLSRQAGNVVLLRPGLTPLKDLLWIAKRTRLVERRNLSFALVYNVVAGLAALLGWVNPLMAALLMPLSSILLILSTWEGLR